MGKELKLFFISIANSMNPNGYYNIVNKPRSLNETASKINKKREAKYKELHRDMNERASEIAVC